MRHTCESCSTAYEIPDAKIAGKFLKVRCKSCGTTMRVVGVRASARNDGAVWWCALGDTPAGPLRDEDVLTLARDGQIQARTRMWCAGLPGWEVVCESERLAWVYGAVVRGAAADDVAGGIADNVFDRAALLSDGHGYFPDPTLKSGIFVLDEETQRSLETLLAKAQRMAPPVPNETLPPFSMATSLATLAVGAAAAAMGVWWFFVEAMS